MHYFPLMGEPFFPSFLTAPPPFTHNNNTKDTNMKIDLELVHTEHHRLWGEFYAKYPTDKERLAHRDEMAFMQETIRALYVLEKWAREEGAAGAKALPTLRYYAVVPSVITHVMSTYLPDMGVENIVAERPEKRKNRWATFDKWTKEHQGEQFTTDQLCEISGFSYPSTLNYVKSSPLFTRVKKGIWEVLTTPERE